MKYHTLLLTDDEAEEVSISLSDQVEILESLTRKVLGEGHPREPDDVVENLEKSIAFNRSVLDKISASATATSTEDERPA
jgi:hypothetical protein